MKNARAALLVGLVVVMGTIAFIAMYSVTRMGFGSEDNTYKTWALFEDVSGLGPGTRVTVAGVQVGEVLSAGISTDHPNLARVEIILRGNVKVFEGQWIDGKNVNGAALTRKSASLLGDQYLELTRGVGGAQITDGQQIPNGVSLSGLDKVMKEMERTGSLVDRMEGIFIKLDGIAADVKAVTGSARNILGGAKGEARLENIANNVQRATSDITEVVTEVRGFTKDTRQFLSNSVLGRGDQIGRIVGNVERFTENAARLSAETTRSAASILNDVKAVTLDVRKVISGSKGDVESSLGTIKGTLATLEGTLKRLDGTLDNVRSITGKIDRGEGTIGKLINDKKIIDSIQETVEDAGTLVKQVTGLETRVELASQYYFGQRALKNYVRLRLQPKHDKYYLIELIDDPRGKTAVSTTVTQSNDPIGPAVVRETSSTTTDDFKFSFQFAKRWHFLTARFGIMESTGGIGLDAEFFKDSLKLTTDLFDFSADLSPRLRILANYTFFKHFEVSGGVDDVFNEDRFDWFLGIGIRFTDDDLKALLTVAPAPAL